MKHIQQIRAPQQSKVQQRAASKVNPAAQLKPTATEPPPVTVHSAESELDLAHSDYIRAQARLLDAMGSAGWKRIAASFIASFCVGYGIGWLASLALEAIAVATFTLTASATAAVVVWVLGVMLTIAVAMYLGRIVGGAVYDGSADRYIATKYQATKSWVSAIFDRKDIELGGHHA